MDSKTAPLLDNLMGVHLGLAEDGSNFAFGFEDGRIVVFDRQGRPKFSFNDEMPEPGNPVWDLLEKLSWKFFGGSAPTPLLRFSPDGSLLAHLYTHSNIISIWSMKDGKLVAQVLAPQNASMDLAISRNNRYLVTVSAGRHSHARVTDMEALISARGSASIFESYQEMTSANEIAAIEKQATFEVVSKGLNIRCAVFSKDAKAQTEADTTAGILFLGGEECRLTSLDVTSFGQDDVVELKNNVLPPARDSAGFEQIRCSDDGRMLLLKYASCVSLFSSGRPPISTLFRKVSDFGFATIGDFDNAPNKKLDTGVMSEGPGNKPIDGKFIDGTHLVAASYRDGTVVVADPMGVKASVKIEEPQYGLDTQPLFLASQGTTLYALMSDSSIASWDLSKALH